MKLPGPNVGGIDRRIRLAGAPVLLVAGPLLVTQGLAGAIAGVLLIAAGLVALVSGTTRFCVLYRLTGVSTAKPNEYAGGG